MRQALVFSDHKCIRKSWDPKRPRGARNCKSEFMVDERAGFPSAADQCTKDEKATMPLEAKISLRQRMKQNMLITTLIITSALKVTEKNILRGRSQWWSSLNGKSRIHKLRYR